MYSNTPMSLSTLRSLYLIYKLSPCPASPLTGLMYLPASCAGLPVGYTCVHKTLNGSPTSDLTFVLAVRARLGLCSHMGHGSDVDTMAGRSPFKQIFNWSPGKGDAGDQGRANSMAAAVLGNEKGASTIASSDDLDEEVRSCESRSDKLSKRAILGLLASCAGQLQIQSLTLKT